MQAKMIVFPNDNGFAVLIWAKGADGTMRVRRFENRTAMVGLLESLHLITFQEARTLESFDFLDTCPLYTPQIDEESLAAHGFEKAV